MIADKEVAGKKGNIKDASSMAARPDVYPVSREKCARFALILKT